MKVSAAGGKRAGKDAASSGKETKSVSPSGRRDPYKNFNFVVEIDGVASAGFMECSGLESETEVIEYREGIDPAVIRVLPGLTFNVPILLRRGITDSKDLSEWRKGVISGNAMRRNGSIVLHDDAHQAVARWNFVQGWPSRMSGPELSATDGDVAIEEIEISHEGIERD